jgi:DHA3 family multidrug efflux protein-like MFS transporter
MKTINQLLIVMLIAVTTTFFVWFALIFWAYLNTQSVITTSIISGTWVVAGVIAGIWFGSIVDHHRKKSAMLGSSIATLALFSIGFILFNIFPQESFSSLASPQLWMFALTVLLGSVAGSMYSIAMPTLVGLVVPEKERAKVNGLLGTIMGLSFGIVSVASGFVVAFGGMFWVLAISIVGTLSSAILLSLVKVPEKRIIHAKEKTRKIDIRGTIKAIGAIPGLAALIIFTTFNNLMGGAFMALMDAYGLNLVPVEVWGIMLGIVSLGFITSGIYISKKGLSKNPLVVLFRLNIIMWILAYSSRCSRR